MRDENLDGLTSRACKVGILERHIRGTELTEGDFEGRFRRGPRVIEIDEATPPSHLPKAN